MISNGGGTDRSDSVLAVISMDVLRISDGIAGAGLFGAPEYIRFGNSGDGGGVGVVQYPKPGSVAMHRTGGSAR